MHTYVHTQFEDTFCGCERIHKYPVELCTQVCSFWGAACSWQKNGRQLGSETCWARCVWSSECGSGLEAFGQHVLWAVHTYIHTVTRVPTYIHTYTHIHMYTYVHIHTVHAQMYMYMCFQSRTYVWSWSVPAGTHGLQRRLAGLMDLLVALSLQFQQRLFRVCWHICVNVGIYVHMWSCAYVCVCVYICTHTRVMYICIYNVCMYVCKHTRSCKHAA